MKLHSIVVSGLLASLAIALSGCRSVREEEAGFVRIFDGKTLNGWTGRSDLWSVRDGAITGITTAENPLRNNTFIVYKEPVENFELRFEYRILGGNSGMQYRSTLMDPEQFIVGGYQADFEAGKTYSGILYEERGRGILAQRGQRTVVRDDAGQTRVEEVSRVGDSAVIQSRIRDGQWNSYSIVANGNHLMHFINGQVTADVVDDQPAKAAKSGILALQIHVGPPMLVQMRNVRLKRLP